MLLNKKREKYFCEFITGYLTLEEFSEFIYSIKKDPTNFIRDLIKQSILIKNPKLVEEIDDNNDFCNLNVKDFIDYIHTKRENPAERLIEIYKILSKDILPTTGRQSLFLYMDSCLNSNSQLNLRCSFDSNICEITGNFKSISFQQIPEHPIGSKCCFYYNKAYSQ